MEIFKLFESTIANVQPGHPSNKDLRRDQLLDNYDEAINSLQVLIKAKENEIAYRRDLVDMLERSKTIYDNKLSQARQSYQIVKKQLPDTLDTRGLSSANVGPTGGVTNKKADLNMTHPSSSTTPPLPPPPSSTATTPSIASNSQPIGIMNSQLSSSSQKSSSDLDIPLPTDSQENRSSLDRRLSEFLKTFPNLTQAGLAQTTNNTTVKPLPGYYTQQPPPPPPIVAAAPPMMAMMRFPPPSLIAPPQNGPPLQAPSQQHNLNSMSQENHDMADMDLSDYDESSNNNGSGSTPASGIIPMVASAMQQGAGGKQHLRADSQSPYASGFNNPVPYAARLNPLPFDPSIMEPRLRNSSSSGRDKHMSHSDRSTHRLSSSSGGSSGGSTKHGSDKNKYSSSSSHSTNRSKRR